MAKIVLGLDIGGANLKAATSAGRALSVPFAVWKQPEKLSAELRKLIAQFPEADEIAATMTAELCDCYETKREGVRRIVEDLKAAAKGLTIRIWSTEGEFVSNEEAIANHMKVAAANWHALASFAGRYLPAGRSMLLDMGSTTTDIIPLIDGRIHVKGITDPDRLFSHELHYSGVKRTPICAIMGINTASEFFATSEDVYVTLGHLPERPEDCDMADGRPMTRRNANTRLARMTCNDVESMNEEEILSFANTVMEYQTRQLSSSFYIAGDFHRSGGVCAILVSGIGDFLLLHMLAQFAFYQHQQIPPIISSLTELIGHEVSACAPAYAVAVLAAERRP